MEVVMELWCHYFAGSFGTDVMGWRHFYGSYDTDGAEIVVRTYVRTYLRSSHHFAGSVYYGRYGRRHFNGSYDTDRVGSATILRKLCFACGSKRHFYGSGTIAPYITTTFNSPRWRPTRRPPRPSCDGCNAAVPCGASSCHAWKTASHSAGSQTLPAMVMAMVVVVVG